MRRIFFAIRGWACVLALGGVLIASSTVAVRAESTFQCATGVVEALVNACGARWEAANIRAHLDAKSIGDADPACLKKTAGLLEASAIQWTASGKYVAITAWPCGSHPAVASADDDVLAQACPGAAWTYANRGQPPECVKLASNQQCAGSDTAIVDACNARWGADNIHAHLLAKSYGDQTPECLEKAADVLDGIATIWLTADKSGAFDAWPCGGKPPLASLDDGILRDLCPGAVWSYENRGVPACRGLDPAPPATPEPKPVDLPTSLSIHGNAVQWWDGLGGVGSGNPHAATSDVVFAIVNCDFQVRSYGNDPLLYRLNGWAGSYAASWTGKLSDIDPDSLRVAPLWEGHSTPKEFVFSFTSRERRAAFTYEGGGFYAPNVGVGFDPQSHVAIEVREDYNANLAPLASLIRKCSS